MRPIFEYIDYRKYLETYYKEQKATKRCFSYRYFAQKAGINSPSFLKWIIDGKRNLTRPATEKFITALKLPPKEAAYFRHLVQFNQAKTSVEKQEHYAALRSMAGTIKESVLSEDQFDYFAEWYIPVVRELVTLYNFKDDYKKIAAAVKPRILPSDAKAAINLLLRLKLLKKRVDGTYVQKDSAVTADSRILSLALQTFTVQMIDHSKCAMENVNFDKRHISGITMGISHRTYSLLNAEIEAFKDRIKAIINRDDECTTVYQMILALFPVSDDVDSLDSMKDRTEQ